MLELVPLWLSLPFAFLFGINVGSFLNVVVFRLPRSCLTVDKPRWSFCPRCRRRLRWYENQPLIGWALLGGRCGGCKMPISLRYPSVELLTGLVWTAAAWARLSAAPQQWAAGLVSVVLLSIIISAALIDYDLRILPDKLTIPGMVLMPLAVMLAPETLPGLDLAALGGRLANELEGPLSWAGLSFLDGLVLGPLRALEGLQGGPWAPRLGALAASLSGMAVGAAAVWSIGVLGTVVFRREAMGFGDVKFMGLLGAACGPRGAAMTLILACLFGGLIGGAHRVLSRRGDGDGGSVPFGPFLASGFFFAFLFPDPTAYWLLNWWPRLWAG